MALRFFHAALLRALRSKARLTQTELGHRIGVTKAAISAYERGQAKPSEAVMAALAEAFDLSIDEWQQDSPAAQIAGAGATAILPPRAVPLLPVAEQAAFAAAYSVGSSPYPLVAQVPVPDLPLTSDFVGPLVIEVPDEAMAPTLRAGTRVLATPVPSAEWPYMPCGVYCLVYRTTLVIRRIKDNRLADEQMLLLHADNRLGGAHPVRAEDLHAVWHVRWATYAPVS